jgi:hypothetical protein
MRLTRAAIGASTATALYDRLQRLEDEEDLSWLGAHPECSDTIR